MTLLQELTGKIASAEESRQSNELPRQLFIPCNLGPMRTNFSCFSLDGVLKGARTKVYPNHRYHRMAWSRVYSKSLLMNVVKTFPIPKMCMFREHTANIREETRIFQCFMMEYEFPNTYLRCVSKTWILTSTASSMGSDISHEKFAVIRD